MQDTGVSLVNLVTPKCTQVLLRAPAEASIINPPTEESNHVFIL